MAGGEVNVATWNYATVGGGHSNGAGGNYATSAGGDSNVAQGSYPTVGGGQSNGASGNYATVGGGYTNAAGPNAATTVAGGWSNWASGDTATVGGGGANLASGNHSTVPGGDSNTAQGAYAFAAGRLARAIQDGTFVWADSGDAEFASIGANSFNARVSGGARFVNSGGTGVQLAAGGNAWAATSDRAAKEHFVPVDARAILQRLVSLPVETWNLKSQDPAIRHIGPMAQDFAAAFAVGEDDTHISTIDADGVAFAAIQGLYQLVQDQNAQLAGRQEQLTAQQEQLAAQDTEIAALKNSVATQEARRQALEARLAALEQAAGQ